ncbi:T9SS type A sorting domain-containing protein [Winogradskyella sp. Asnod2-B02-A]|uniref:T9SS type A sorting domain-containing protein n=1 Tax=Winogradskyella sp. Asnod2-B02-A TaxID=3160583 RepID=UPI00386A9130
MKQFYVTLILVFCLQFCFGQIGFEENFIVDEGYYTPLASDAFSADIDNDGDLDLISASKSNNQIAWHENIDGAGTFASHLNIISSNAQYATAVYAADIDGDGDIDVLSASSQDNKIAWYENINGIGLFSDEKIITINASQALSVVASDIDGDGDMDVVSASSQDNKIAWYENLNGDGDFSSEQVISNIAFGANTVYTTDIDGDGDIDILSSSNKYNFTDKLAWYENLDGQGTFSGEHLISTQPGTNSVYSIDIDNDNDMDVIAAHSDYNSGFSGITWYENTNGLGEFNSGSVIIGTLDTAKSVFAADIDNDGLQDVLSASRNDNTIAWYKNLDGFGNFSSKQIITTNAVNASSVHVSDIDGDGDNDVISTSEDHKVSWYENLDGQGDFGPQQIASQRQLDLRRIIASDINQDGFSDLIIASSTDDRIAWYKNLNGTGTFDDPINVASQIKFTESIVSADIDGDGDMDILTALLEDNKVSWFENNNNTLQNWLEHVVSDNPEEYAFTEVGDLDGDGDLDIISSSFSTNSIYWYENLDGLGNYGNSQIIDDSFGNAFGFVVEDIDSDGDADVVAISQLANEVVWYKNTNGLGEFSEVLIISDNLISPSDIKIYDIDNDSDLDIVCAGNLSDNVIWFENTDGQGNFDSHHVVTDNYQSPFSLNIGDLDNDGDGDIILTSIQEGSIWFENLDGQGNFGSNLFINDIHCVDSFVIDLNNDMNLDLVSISNDNSESIIFWNKNLGITNNEINGTITFDLDLYGCDVNDPNSSHILVTSQDSSNNEYSTFTNLNGFFQLIVGEGNHTTQIQSNIPNYYYSNPESHLSSFIDVGNTDNVNFCIEAIGAVNDLNIAVHPTIDDPRPGFNTTYQIVYNNIGTTQLSGSVSFEFNESKLNFLNASETVTSQTANILIFDFTELNPFETRTIDIEFNVFAPPTTNIDDILISTATINPVSGDETEEDNIFTLEQTVIGSYDPNDITVLEGEEISIEEADKYLHYLIRFQNTGTASAINVRVEHILDSKLDWTTMQLESLSHTGRVEITNETDVSFVFNNINLANSTYDEPNSHGYIAYKIKPKSDVVVGDIISGTADIFFDFNPPITTNTVNTEIVAPLSVGEFNAQSIQVYPNPVKNKLEITSSQVVDKLTVIDINGRLLKAIKLSNLEYSLDVSSLTKGVYFLEIKSGESKSTKKFIKN